MKPDHKELSRYPEAVQCNQAIDQSAKLIQQQNWQHAKEYLDQALKYAEHSTHLLYQRSLCWYHMGENYETIADTGRVLKLEADNLQALELRGRCYYILGEIDTAMVHFRKGLVLDPEHKGCKHFYKMIKSVNDNRKKYDKAINKNDHTEAVKWLLKIIEVDNEHRTIVPRAKIDLGKSYRVLKQYNNAQSVLEDAIKRDENNAEAYKILGQILVDLEEYDQAIHRLNKAKELDQSMIVVVNLTLYYTTSFIYVFYIYVYV